MPTITYHAQIAQRLQPKSGSPVRVPLVSERLRQYAFQRPCSRLRFFDNGRDRFATPVLLWRQNLPEILEPLCFCRTEPFL
jgi:hypothetical protein